MSGNFTQRGLPACAEKHQRAKHAILAGADMVVELPTIFATASAENFAYGAVKIANELGVDYLVFGSECGSIEKLIETTRQLSDSAINTKIKAYMNQGNSYPKAVSLAVQGDIVDSPNNLLAIEYIKALHATSSSITPVTIERENNYNSLHTQQFASSSALRSNPALRQSYTYSYVTEDLDDNIEEEYCKYATHALSLIPKETWIQIEGVSEGIENRFIAANKQCGYNNLLDQVKTKRYTRAKLQRIVFNAVMNITKNDVQQAKASSPQITVLAIEKGFVNLLSKCTTSDWITQKADNLFQSFCSTQPPNKLQKISR